MSTAISAPFARKPQAAAMLPLLLVFVCGFAVGALSMSLVFHNGPHRAAVVNDGWNKETVLKWKKELNLTDRQQKELEKTLDDTHKYYDNVLAFGKDQMLSILNEDQRRKFEKLLHDGKKP